MAQWPDHEGRHGYPSSCPSFPERTFDNHAYNHNMHRAQDLEGSGNMMHDKRLSASQRLAPVVAFGASPQVASPHPRPTLSAVAVRSDQAFHGLPLVPSQRQTGGLFEYRPDGHRYSSEFRRSVSDHTTPGYRGSIFGQEVQHLLRADPDEEYQPPVAHMERQREQRPSGAQANEVLADLVARFEEGEKHRVRMGTQLDELVHELRSARASQAPVPQAASTTGDNQLTEMRTTLEQLQQRLWRIEQEGVAASSRRISGAKGDSMAENNDAADDHPAPAQKRRSLSENQGSAAVAAKRAKMEHQNMPDDGEPGPHSVPLPCRGPNSPIDHDNGGIQQSLSFLNFLKRMDCTSDTDLLRLKQYVQGTVSYEFPLCTEASPRVDYFLKVGGRLSTMIAASPDNPQEQPGPDQAAAENLNILEFALAEKGPGNGAANNNPICPSSYLVALGEVYAAHRSANRAVEVTSTNFFVLMDVTTPQKSLWMIYRYERPFQRKEGTVWEPVNVRDLRKTLFKGGNRNFDTVCLLDSVRDWKTPVQDMITMDRFGSAVLEHKSNVLWPVFYTPVLAAFREVLKKGWEGGAVQEQGEEE